MTRTASHSTARAICDNARLTLMYADRLLEGIDADTFARLPDGVRCNHPAFCFGHLSIYPDRLLAYLGREDLTDPRPKYNELFKAGAECRDDPDGTIYPPMHEIVEYFRDRYGALMTVLENIDEEALRADNPNEKMSDIIASLGGMIMFMVGGHPMSHLGQVSTWRRVMGHGSALGF